MTTHINQIRRAASAEAGKFSYDLFDLIGDGSENAADTMGDRSDYDSEEFSSIAVSTIASALCERSFAPPNGSNPKAVRDWFFANGVSA